MTYHALWIKSKAPQRLTWPDLQLLHPHLQAPLGPRAHLIGFLGSPWPGRDLSRPRPFSLVLPSAWDLNAPALNTADPLCHPGLQSNISLMSLASLRDMILQLVSPCSVSPPFHMLLWLVFLVIKVFPHQTLAPQNQGSSLTCSLVCPRQRIEVDVWQAFSKHLLNESINVIIPSTQQDLFLCVVDVSFFSLFKIDWEG